MAKGDQDTTATEFCNNCKRDIPSINYLMHQNHCSRNIVLCSQCQEPVPRSEMDEHNEDYHIQVTCKCGQVVEKCKQDEHDSEQCPQRQVTCEYCEMEMDFKNMAEHTDFCGSRTDPCPLCSRYIFFRDKARHKVSNCKFPEVKPAKLNAVESSTQRDQWHRNELLYGAAEPNQFPPGLREQFSFPPFRRTREGMGERSVATEAIMRNISDGMTADRKQRKNQDRVQNVMAKKPTRGREKNEERALLQSSVNQEELDHHLAHHLAQDLSHDPSFSPDLSPDEAYPRNDPPSYRDYQDDFAIQEILKESYSIPAINTFHEQSSVLGDLTLPCEFCQQPIPASTLIQHQSGCRPDLACHPVQEPGKANNGREWSHSHPQQPAGVLNNLSYGPTLPGYSSVGRQDSPPAYNDDNLLMLPCEFCEVLLPADALPMHQVNCVENCTVTPAPATFDTDPGSYPARRGGAVESPVRPTPHRAQRPQDFAVPSRPKIYNEEPAFPGPSIDGDDNGVDTVPVRMPKPRQPLQMKSRQPQNPVLLPTFQSGTSQPLPFARSTSEKYLHTTNRTPRPRPAATVASLPSGGAVQEPEFKNTAGSAQTRYLEERPQSKSSSRVQETLQELCDAPIISSDEELNNLATTRLSTRPAGDRDLYTQINNSSQYKSKTTNFPPSSYDPSSLELEGPPQFNPPSGPGKPSRQSTLGARQKVRKSHSNNRGVAPHGDGYSPSFPGGVNPRKGGDSERQGNSGRAWKSKQPLAPTAMTLEPDGLTPPLRIKEESNTHRTANRNQAQRRKTTAPKNTTKYRGDPMP